MFFLSHIVYFIIVTKISIDVMHGIILKLLKLIREKPRIVLLKSIPRQVDVEAIARSLRRCIWQLKNQSSFESFVFLLRSRCVYFIIDYGLSALDLITCADSFPYSDSFSYSVETFSQFGHYNSTYKYIQYRELLNLYVRVTALYYARLLRSS